MSMKSRSARSPKPLRAASTPATMMFEPLDPRLCLAVIAWDGGPTGDGTDWSVAANWAGDVVPGPADDAHLVASGTSPTITLAGTSNVNSVTSSRSVVLSGTLTLAAASSFAAGTTLTQSGGVLNGVGNLSAAGALVWTSGSMSGTGRTIVAAGATLTLSGGAKTLARTLENDGAATWTAGSWLFNNGAVQNDGSFLVSAEVTTIFAGGTNTFANNGTFTKTGPTTVTFTSVAFSNAGSVVVSGGTLDLAGGGTGTGTADISAGATMALGGTHALSAGLTVNGTLRVDAGTTTLGAALTGSGTLQIAGGTTTIASTFVFGGSLVVSGGTLNGAGVATFNGASSTWSGGTMSGTGRTVIGPSGVLALNGSSKTLSRVLEIDGAAAWTAGTWLFNAGTVQNDGAFTANGALTTVFAGGTNALNNNGSFTKSGSNTVSFTSVAFSNAGTLLVSAGALDLSSGGTSPGSATIAPDAALALSGPHVLSGPVSAAGTVRVDSGTTTFNGALTGTGVLHVQGGTATLDSTVTFAGALQLTGGTLSGTASATFGGASTWTGGAMTGTGRTIIGAAGSLSLGGSSKTLARTLEIDGTAVWTAGNWIFTGGTAQNDGTFTVSGAVTTIFGGGVNAFSNNGAFFKTGAGAATLTSTAFSNAGSLDVQQGTLDLAGGGAGTGTVNVNAGATLALAGTHGLGGTVTVHGTLRVDAGTTTFTASLTGTGLLNLVGGTTSVASIVSFDGDMQLAATLSGGGTITINGASTWSGGTMSGAGRTVIGPAGSLTMNGTTKTLSRTLEIDGSAAWTAGLWSFSGGTVQNDGAFDVQAAVTTLFGGGVNAFTNNGTFTKSGDTVAGLSTPVFTNTGTLHVALGTLELGNGSSAGVTTIDAGGTLDLGGTQTITGAVGVAGRFRVSSGVTTIAGSLTGGGTLDVEAGALTVSVDVTFDGALALSGTLNGDGDLAVNGASTWTGGSMAGSGRTTIGPKGTLALSGSSKTLARILEVDGSATWTAGFLVFNAGTVENDGELTVNGNVNTIFGGGVNAFVNSGTFIKTGANAASFSSVVFTNPGTLVVAQGTLSITPPAGTFVNDGTILLGAGALFEISGAFTQSPGAAIEVDIGGEDESRYGRIVASGVATLDGSLAGTLVDGYSPEVFTRFDIVTGSSVVGTFASVAAPGAPAPNRRWVTLYQPNRAQLVYTSTSDWNNDGLVNSTDVSDFINDWFLDQLKGTLLTDFNDDGVSNSTDVSDFINVWFTDQ